MMLESCLLDDRGMAVEMVRIWILLMRRCCMAMIQQIGDSQYEWQVLDIYDALLDAKHCMVAWVDDISSTPSSDDMVMPHQV